MKPYNTEHTKTDEVRDMFDNIAPKYDLLNHTLSANVDKLWRRKVVRIVRRFKPRRILDVATGTGDLAIAMAKKIENAQILGVDISVGMLDVAHGKIAACGLDEKVVLDMGDAEHLDIGDNTIDVATVAFGVRNFGNIENGLKEIARTIKPAGHIVILEFSTPHNPMIRFVYNFYSHRILPRIGGLISKDKKAYEYLPASVDEFPAPKNFIEMMQRSGFKNCRAKSRSCGIAHIYIGEKL